MSLWVTLPGRVEAGRLLAASRAEGVGFLPGAVFSVSRRHDFSFRLSFAGQPPARIRQGMAILARLASRLGDSAPSPEYSRLTAIV